MAGLDYRSWWEENSISMRDRRDIWIQPPSLPDINVERLWIQEIKIHLSTVCLNSDSDVNSGNQYLSVQHPNTKSGKFSCAKSIAEDSMKRVNRQPSSASPNAYDARWVPSWQLPLDALNPMETVNINGFPSSPLLFGKSTNEVTASSNVSSRQRASVSVMADEAEMKQQAMHATIGAPCLVPLGIDSGSCVLPTGVPLYRHYSLNYLTDESSDKPAINPLHEPARTPVAHKRTDEDSEHHSNPNPCVAERGIFEKANRSDTWYIATGAAHHATGNRHLFTILEVENSDLCVHAADGTPMPVCGRGNVVTDTVLLSDVWYVPGLDVNLVSVGQLAELDYSIGFARGSCTISSAADTVVGRAHAREDGLYEVDFLQVPLGIP